MKQKQRQKIEVFENNLVLRQEGFNYTGKYFYIFEDNNAASANFGYTHMCWDVKAHCRICQSDVNIHFFHSEDNSKVFGDSKSSDIDESEICHDNINSKDNSSIFDVDNKNDLLSYSKITFQKKTPLDVCERRRTLYDSVNNQLIFIVEPKAVNSNDQMCLKIYQCPVTDVTKSRMQEFDFSSDGSITKNKKNNVSNNNIEPGMKLTYQGNSEFHYQLYQNQNQKTYLGIFARNEETNNEFIFDLVEIQGRSSMKIVGTRIIVNADATFTDKIKNRQNDIRTNNNEVNNGDANENNDNTNINKENDAKSGKQYMRKVMNMVEECKMRFYIQDNSKNSTTDSSKNCTIFFTNLPDSLDILECDHDSNKITRYTLEDDINTESFQHCKDNIFMNYTPQTGNLKIFQFKSGTIYTIKTICFQKQFGDIEVAPQHPMRCQLLTPFPGKYIIDAQYEDKDNSNSIR